MNCAACHQQLNLGARFCSFCGTAVPVPQPGSFYGRRIVRPRYGRMLGGVCAGIADHYGWDPVVIRLIAVALFFVGCGSLFLAYLVAWIVIPNEPYFWMPTPFAQPPAGPGAPASGYAGGTGSTPIS